VAAGLGVVSFGGNSHASGSTSAVTEIWECSFAMEITDASTFTGFTQTFCGYIADQIEDWFTSTDAKICDTEELAYVKWNEFSLATGHQLTDPTIVDFRSVRGIASGDSYPVSMTYRISLDNSTRNPRARGGFFPPRTGLGVQPDGRIRSIDAQPMAFVAKSMFDNINILFGADATVAIWSRRDKATHIVNRVRVGDVPDNISRRRNHLRETYYTETF